MAEKHEHHEKKKHIFYVDGKEYESESSELTGAQIRAKVPDVNPEYALTLEGQGHHPNRVIRDDERVPLEGPHGPNRFILVPPANFGNS